MFVTFGLVIRAAKDWQAAIYPPIIEYNLKMLYSKALAVKINPKTNLIKSKLTSPLIRSLAVSSSKLSECFSLLKMW